MMDTFSNSTFIEGYADDGSLNYGFYPDGSGFISHAHGRSTGPVYFLLANVVGLRATALDVPSKDGDWVFQPSVQGSGLMWARGGFNTSHGGFGAKWEIGEDDSFSAEMFVSDRLQGTVYAPMMGNQRANITINGRPYIDSNIFNGFMRYPGVGGGSHIVKVA